MGADQCDVGGLKALTEKAQGGRETGGGGIATGNIGKDGAGK